MYIVITAKQVKRTNGITRISQGFNIEKTYEEMLKTWHRLETGDIEYDNPYRAGQWYAPMSL